MNITPVYTLDFDQVNLKDIARVGGKNTSLGQLFNALRPNGIGVVDGFATTSDAYRRLLTEGHLENRLREILTDADF